MDRNVAPVVVSPRAMHDTWDLGFVNRCRFERPLKTTLRVLVEGGVMLFQPNPEAIAFVVAALIAGGLAGFAWQRRRLPMAPPFATMMAGEAIWALFEAIELESADLPTKRVCYALRIAGTATAILGMLAFVLRWTGHVRWLARRRFGPICAAAVALVALAWTDPWHHRFWTRFANASIGGFQIAATECGPGFWAAIAFFYTIVGLSIFLLAQAVAASKGLYRAQAAVMLFGVLVPSVIELLDWSDLFWFIHVDSVSLSFVLTGLAFLPGLLRFRLLDLTPVAWAVVVRGINDPVVVIDRWGRIVELNPAARRLAGVSYPEILGVDAARGFVHWSTLARRLVGITDHGEQSFEVDGPDPAVPTTFDARISRIGGRASPSGWVLVLRDITERKRAAEERVRLLHEQTARALAEASNRAKDRFIATLSHELRTPLTPVLATVSAMLGDSDTPETLRPVVEMIRRNVDLEARLIDDLLDLARIGRDALFLERQVIDLHELIGHVVEICRDDFDRARLQLVLDLTATRHHVDADPIRLQQALWNLIKNAIKFTPAGGQVTVRSCDRNGAPDGEAAAAVLIEVSDTGIGIEHESLPGIFNLTEPEVTAATRQFGGLGLGLSLCRSIVEQHHGRLAVASAGAGLGATFTIEMPTVSVPAVVPTARPISPAVDPGEAMTRRPVRILLVEDNEDTLNFLATILARKGHHVRTAPDLASALRSALAADFDLLISDIELPDGTGLELMRTIRSSHPVPGIALSGFGSKDDIEQSRAAGFALHLTKPVDFRRLEQAILRFAANVPTERMGTG